MLDWITSNWMLVVTIALTVIGAASVVAKLIAPLTKTKADDKVAWALDKLLSVLNKLALNTPGKK